MINVLRSYNENAMKQVLRTAADMAAKSSTYKAQGIIKKMIRLSEELDIAIRNQMINGLEKENEEYLNQ